MSYRELLQRGVTLYRAEEYAEARDVLRAALEAGEKEHGPDAVELLKALRSLAEAIGEDKHDRVEPEELHERALQIAQAAWGPDALGTAGAQVDVGLDLWDLKRLEEAADQLQRAYATRIRTFGDGDDFSVCHAECSAMS